MMQTDTTIHYLTRIADDFGAILGIAIECRDSLSVEGYGSAMAVRQTLLNTITANRRELETRCPDWRELIAHNGDVDRLSTKITATITEITAIDARCAQRLQQEMDRTRKEMQAVYHTGKAARAYTQQKFSSTVTAQATR